jgi:hypothetical protein
MWPVKLDQSLNGRQPIFQELNCAGQVFAAAPKCGIGDASGVLPCALHMANRFSEVGYKARELVGLL